MIPDRPLSANDICCKKDDNWRNILGSSCEGDHHVALPAPGLDIAIRFGSLFERECLVDKGFDFPGHGQLHFYPARFAGFVGLGGEKLGNSFKNHILALSMAGETLASLILYTCFT